MAATMAGGSTTHKGRVTESDRLTDAEIEARNKAKIARRTHILTALMAAGVGVAGIALIAVALWAGWVVAGIVAIKLGLLGFWWHLLSFGVVGTLVAAIPAKVGSVLIRMGIAVADQL